MDSSRCANPGAIFGAKGVLLVDFVKELGIEEVALRVLTVHFEACPQERLVLLEECGLDRFFCR